MDKNELMGIVGSNLQKYREEAGMTQEALAEKVGISTSFYANLERGKKGMSIFVLRDIADALGVSVDYLLYTYCKDTRIKNIETMLNNLPPEFVESIEKMIRLCINEFSL